MEFKNMSILNKINYKSECDTSFEDVIDSYIGLIRDFLIDYKKIIMLNNDYYKFIMEKGIRCITNIYCIFLNYSNNVEFTEIAAKNALLYFIEFIGQIKQTSLTDFNSKDVLVFVYKKTIFDVIKTDYKYIHMNKLEWIIQIYIYMVLYMDLSNQEQDEWLDIFKQVSEEDSLETIYQFLVIKKDKECLKKLYTMLKKMNLSLNFKIDVLGSSLNIIYK